MDRSQLILLGLPIFLFCSDLFNLFTPPPPKPHQHRPHQPPHIPHQQRPAVTIPETLDFPSQKTSGLGAIGYGNTVEINFCVSCSYKGTAVTMKKMLETAFPGLDVILANYPPPAPKRLLAKIVPVAQMGVIGMIVIEAHNSARFSIPAQHQGKGILGPKPTSAPLLQSKIAHPHLQRLSSYLQHDKVMKSKSSNNEDEAIPIKNRFEPLQQ